MARTSRESGINARTIYRWRKEYTEIDTEGSVTLTTLTTQKPLSDDEIEALREIQGRMLHEAYALVNSLHEKINSASLYQRVAALSQLIDRIIKLAGQLPRREGESLMDVEYDRSEEEGEN